MFFKEFIILYYFFLLANTAPSQVPVGNWRDHLPYHSTIKVVTGKDRIYCATPYSLFTVDFKDNNLERLSKTNGLHEVGISTMHFDNETNKLLIAYTNSNIDILYQNKIINIDAIKRKDIQADKTVHNIFCYRQMAYLATSLGIIVIDETKYEVKDTYVIGKAGNNVKVTGITADENFIYAASAEGLKKAGINSINLADYRNWQLQSGVAGLPQGPVEQVFNVEDKIVVQKDDSLFVLNDNSWKLLYTSGWKIINTNLSSGSLVLSQRMPTGAGRVIILNADGSIQRTIEQSNIINPQQAAISLNDVWIADLSKGLIRSSATGLQSYQPNSPVSIATGEMTVQKNSLWVASGSVTADWNNTHNRNGLYRFTGNEWSNYNPVSLPSFDNLYDLVSIAVDTRDNTLWAGSFGGGLVQLKEDRSVTILRENSPIEASLSDPDSYRVAGLAFDKENNLWISNYGAVQNLVVRKADGGWKKFSIPFSHNDNAVTQIVIDDVNQKWIVSPNGNGLFCLNHGSSIENAGDDRWKYFRAGLGNGNLPDNNVTCISRDKKGFIWIGTRKGVGIIQCPREVFSNTGCNAVLPIMQQDNFAGYLFRDEEVQCIAVDGADRKWVGTKNGVWLLNADAEKTLFRFKEDNSPLLSNDVRKIAIDPESGEVFFATIKGICSFRGTATEGGSTNENVLVFPNPVPPSYNGTIAIRGLVNNAIVKITELDGRLVYQTRAAGGQAVWSGKDYKGRKISTGVYLVIVSDDQLREQIITKIVFIQ